MKNIALIVCLILGFGLFAQNEVKTCFENGNVQMEMIKVGARSMQTTYYETGEIKQMGSFYNAVPAGTWKTYNIHGEIIAEGEYVDGKKSGRWVVLTPNSKRKYELYYEDGVRIDAIALK